MSEIVSVREFVCTCVYVRVSLCGGKRMCVYVDESISNIHAHRGCDKRNIVNDG